MPGGQDPSNCVAYWTDLSNGQYDAGGSRVFGWIDIGHTRAEIDAFSGSKQRRQLAAWGREAAVQAGIRLADFRQVVFGYNINADHGSVGGNSIVLAYAEGRPFEPTFMHHEFGHALGLGHSSSQNDGVYGDRFDIMSAMSVWKFQDILGRAAGPGAAAPNLENLGWLDWSRVWQFWPATPQTFTLAALNRPAVNGYLAARLQFPPPSNKVYYLEYREATAWDRGLPGPRVLVHTRNAENGPEIIGGGWNPVGALQVGQELVLPHSPDQLVVRVQTIDTGSSRATVTVWVEEMLRSTDLTSFIFGGHIPAGDPIAYITDFPGQGPTAHVVYSNESRIYELFYDPRVGGWSNADLLAFRGSPAAAGDPTAYVTDFPGQGPTARIVYRTANNQIYELSYVAATRSWQSADLTFVVPGGPSAAGDPTAYVTDFPGQGPTARIVYRNTGSDDVYELSYAAATLSWQAEDLTRVVSGPPAAGDPIAFVTDFPGQGPTAHVVYRANNGHVYDLSLPTQAFLAASGSWVGIDLTALCGGPPAAGDPIAYVTDFPGQGPTARIVYRTANNQIYELSYVAATRSWQSADLTALGGLGGDPPAAGDPIAFVTDVTGFPGQGPAAHVVYRANNGHVYDLSSLAAPWASGSWVGIDLTAWSGGPPAAGDPIAYVTDFPGQGPTARIVYRTANNQIYELSYVAAQGVLGAENLTALCGGPPAAGDPIAYVTDFPGQGLTARIVYRSTVLGPGGSHVYELFYVTASVPELRN